MKTETIARRALEKSYQRSVTFLAWLENRIAIHERKLAAENKKLERLQAVFDPCELGAQKQIDRARENIGELDRVIAELQGRADMAKNVCHSEKCQLFPVKPFDPGAIQFSRELALRAPGV